MTSRCRRRLFAPAIALVLGACAMPADTVAEAAESAKERTVPPGEAYTTWVEGRLVEYRRVEKGRDRLRLSRQREADLYVVELAAKPGSEGLGVDASFEGMPF